MDYPLVSHKQEQQRRRRGRPCAMERYHNERLQAQFSSLISQSSVDFDSDFAKLNIIPFITRRQRRARANDRERTRMQALNEALDVLKSCLPLELLLRDFETENSLKQKKAASSASTSAATANNKTSSQDQCDTTTTNTNTQVVKLTKIDTLKLASKYIAMLTRCLNGGGVGGCGDLVEWHSSGTMTESSTTESPLDSPGGLVVAANYQNNINADFQADLSVNNRIGYQAYPTIANGYQNYHSGFIQQTQNQSYHHQENDQLNSFYYKDEDTCTH